MEGVIEISSDSKEKLYVTFFEKKRFIKFR